MRTIKFRGKKIQTDEWLYGDLMHDNIGGIYIYPINAENLYKENAVRPDTVGQFTGVYDHKKQEVWEGDIIVRKGLKGKGEVFYHKGSFYVAFPAFIESLHHLREHYSIRVVGNKHEPEKIPKWL